MTRPEDEIAAANAGGSRLRASHADREQVIDALKAAFVQGRLDKGEFDARVGQAVTSRTYAELAALTADIAAEPAASSRRQGPAAPAGQFSQVDHGQQHTAEAPDEILPSRSRPTRGRWIDGVLAGAVTRSATSVIDPTPARAGQR